MTSGKGRKHPHERGEDRCFKTPQAQRLETPPRAWGRLLLLLLSILTSGNTPTSVGKTLPLLFQIPPVWKHPHERGEDGVVIRYYHLRQETPPRAWGRPVTEPTIPFPPGNTPTSVGKTPSRAGGSSERRKHPHERGEDYTDRCYRYAGFGNTPTSVGKTYLSVFSERVERKHPHERGEDSISSMLQRQA